MGPTSHDVVAIARRNLGTRRVGHTGTLDPFASGLLPLLVGPATRLMPYLVGLDKRYTGALRLGVRTDTDDRQGATLAEDAGWTALGDERVREAMTALTGRIEQVPPAFSAKKIAGRPAHWRARRGEAVALAPQSVEVRRFVMTHRDGPDVTFEADVGSGTYVRALARDLGERLGCGAHLRALRRTAVGPWRVEEAVPLSALERGEAAPIDAIAAVAHLPSVPLTPEECDAIGHGRPLERVSEPGPTALVADGRLVAVADADGAQLRPRVVLEASA